MRAAAAAPAMPPKSPPVTNRPISRLASWGPKTSLTAIQNWVTDMAMKMSAQKQKAITKTGKWFHMIVWAQSRKMTPEVSATGVEERVFWWTSKMSQKTRRPETKNRSEAVR